MGRSKGKLSKGQPKGSRSASGRKRDRTPVGVMPCEGVMRRRQLYGQPVALVGAVDAKARQDRGTVVETDTCDALGRAFCAGLLGTGSRAQDRLNAGRRVAAAYWAAYGFSTPDSLARFQPQQPAQPADPDRDQRREASLHRALDLINGSGREVRAAFDQLVIDPNPDAGPAWLDAIVLAHHAKTRAYPSAYQQMERALNGLDLIA